MESLELERLFLLYKSGHNSEPDSKRPDWQRQFHSDILQIANATAPDLSEEDFGFIAMQVEVLSSMHNKEWPRSEWHKEDGSYKLSDGSHEGKLDGWLSKGEYQKMLWDLPEYMQKRHKPFRPNRDRQNRPVERSSEKVAQSVGSGAAMQPNEAASVSASPVPMMPTINPAEVRKAITTGRNEDDSEHPGEPAPGMVRVYHTGSIGSGSAMDKRWVTTQENYNFRPDAPLHYLDLPETDKRLTPEYPEQGVKQGFHFNFELEPHEAAKLKPMPKRKPQSENKSSWDDLQASNAAWIENTKADLLKSVFGKDREQREQIAAERPVGGAASQASSGSSFINKLQNILDAVGVFDPTPITDGVNMAISLGRALTDPRHAGTHLVNAATSAVSMVPYVGDLAKLGKFGAKAASKKAGAAAKATTHGGTASTMAGLAGAAVQMATGDGGSVAAGGSGGASPPGTPIDGSGAGSGSGGGGLIPSAGGFDWGNVMKWSGIGAGIFMGFKTAMQQGRDLRDMFKPINYTGNSFDSFKDNRERLDSTIDATMPMAKYTMFEQVRRKAMESIQRLVDWLKDLESVGNKTIDLNRKLTEYSGEIAVAFNQLDVARIRRDISKAQTMGGDFKNLAAAQDRLEAAKQDLFQPLERLQVAVQTELVDIGAKLVTMIDTIEPFTESIEKFVDWWQGHTINNDARNGLEDAIRKSEERPLNRLKG